MVSDVVEALPSGFARAAVAPATVGLIGELTDFYGGAAIYGLTQYQVAVAIRPRQDDEVRVEYQLLNQKSETSSASAPEVSSYANACLAGETPDIHDESLAFRAAGLIWTMIHRQVLSRDTAGMDIHIISNIPAHILGSVESTDSALALALAGNVAEIDEAPMRAKLVELAAQSAHMFSNYPARTARYAAALRGPEDSLCTIDFADDSVSPTNGMGLSCWIAINEDLSTEDSSEEIRRRKLLTDACAAFGVPSLQALPDAQTRVVEWLRAVNKVRPETPTPSIEEVHAWLDYYHAESSRARTAQRVLASRRTDAFLELISSSHLATSEFLHVEPADSPSELGHLRTLAPGCTLVLGSTAPETRQAIALEQGGRARVINQPAT